MEKKGCAENETHKTKSGKAGAETLDCVDCRSLKCTGE